ncbi:aliphatic sulfonates ABC transporter ATP-binding protein [Nonomuraea maheshkhaliensis]|uniref:Aliphatic sulfonates ABC transporter ATP-binding protein n=1 Tax=Nonomuraea maheshkhaliensis TaxID=419590 RepID=A0ABP4SA75_9ACTN
MAAHTGELTRVKGLTRVYGDRAVLDGLDLELAPGEFVALLGRSGSGKSTLLRALAGLDGDLTDGHSGRRQGGRTGGRTGGARGWTRVRSGPRTSGGTVEVPDQVSVVFQDARLLPWQRVLPNVVLGLPPGAERRGRESLAEVGLAGRERAWPNELSGGEQQRVALARSLVREPRLLLADEPFGALDALTRLKMHALLRRLYEQHRPSVLLVTHDVDEAIALADRVLVLDDGRIATEQRLDGGASHAELRAVLLRALGVTDDDRDEAVRDAPVHGAAVRGDGRP